MPGFYSNPAGDTGTLSNYDLSAYHVWLSLGNIGSREEFILTLQGAPGADGELVADAEVRDGVDSVIFPVGLSSLHLLSPESTGGVFSTVRFCIGVPCSHTT